MTTDITQIKFRPGEFYNFVATRSFELGSTQMKVAVASEVLFDGTVVEYGGGRYTLPTLRGAIRAGWLVLFEEYDPDAPVGPAPSANIQVRSAVNQGNNPMAPAAKQSITTVANDEREVMNHRTRTAAAHQQTQQARQQARPQAQAGGGVARSFGNTDVEVGGAEFGVPVARSFLTSAKATNEVTPDKVGSAIRQADQVKVQPGQGISEEDYVARMTEEQRDLYFAKKESARAGVTSRVNPNYSGPQVTNVAPQQQRPVTRVMNSRTGSTQTREGITTTMHVGGGTEIADPTGYGGKPVESVQETEGIKFSNTNGPKRYVQPPVNVDHHQAQASASQLPTPPPEEGTISKIEKDGTADTRKRIAKTLCADFPDAYNFSDHWKRRLAMIRLNYEERADVIEAIFAAESDDFKKVLMEEFPQVFAT